MREVPVLLFRSMRRMLERYGIHTAPCLEDLPLARVPAWAIGGRVNWDDLAIFLERSTAHLTPEEQERVGELYPLENHFVQYLVRSTLSPRLLHRIGWASTKRAFPHMDIGVDELTDQLVAIHMELPRTHRGSAFFFRGTVGECRTLTELLGLGPSLVTADVGPWHGRYVVRFPGALADDDGFESQRLLLDRRWKLPTLIAWLFGHEVEGSDAALLDRLERAHGLSAAEATTVVRLGRGVSVPEIAYELGLSVSEVERLLRQEHERIGEAVRAELVAHLARSA
jgi:DNA-binding CsgD family transcriptional regulator